MRDLIATAKAELEDHFQLTYGTSLRLVERFVEMEQLFTQLERELEHERQQNEHLAREVARLLAHETLEEE